MKCPTCHRMVTAESCQFRPFCSERCKLVDLGRWLDGSYAIPGEPVDENETADADVSSGETPDRKLH